MIRVRVRGATHSVLEPYAEEDWSDIDPGIEAACAAYRAGGKEQLAFDPASAAMVADGLLTLANGEDDIAENQRSHPEERAMARRARDGLTALRSRVFDIAYPQHRA